MVKPKYKNYAEKVGRGVRGLSKKYKKYAPAVKKAAVTTHKVLRVSAETIHGSLIPAPRRKGYIDMTQKRKPKPVRRKKGGFYLDFT